MPSLHHPSFERWLIVMTIQAEASPRRADSQAVLPPDSGWQTQCTDSQSHLSAYQARDPAVGEPQSEFGFRFEGGIIEADDPAEPCLR